MNYIVPLHQFEIRYSQLINFAVSIKEVLAPFIPMSTNITVEKENSSPHTKYTLLFDSSYSILVTWDRLVLKYEGDIELLSQNSSIAESPFFAIYEKIQSLEEFGKVLNCLSFTVFINKQGKELEEIVKNFKSKYLQNSTDHILSNPTDFGVVLDKKIEEQQVSVRFGPYVGLQDLLNRAIHVQSPDMINEVVCVGEMAEIKIFEPVTSINFSKYKKIIKSSTEYIDKLWPKS
jgi:hypothetical protein